MDTVLPMASRPRLQRAHDKPPNLAHLKPLPCLGHIRFLQHPYILLPQHKLTIPHRLINPLLAPQPNNRLHALSNRPRRRHTRHAHVVLLRDLLHALNNLFVGGVLAVVHERLEEVVGGGAFGGSAVPRAGEGAAGDGGPGD